jgi:hypothetical protein
MVVAFDGVLGLDLNQVAIVARSQGISLEDVLPYLHIAEDEYLSIVKKKREAKRT